MIRMLTFHVFHVPTAIKSDVVEIVGAINPRRGAFMRLLVLSFPLIAGALMSCSSLPMSTPSPNQTQAISAQSSNEYAWCAFVSSLESRNCYYTSYEQCKGANSGLADFCVKNPRYRPS